MNNIDYAQCYRVIRAIFFQYLIGVLFLLVLLIYGCIYCCKICLTINANKSSTNKLHKNFTKEHLIYVIVFAILAIVSVFLIAYLVKGEFAKDLPYVKNNNYLTVTGEVVEQGAKPEFGLRTVYVKKASNDIIKCEVGGATYELGKLYEIIYLPNTRIACIVRQFE